MKRFDQIKQMDINELAGLLCETHENVGECNGCMVRDYCKQINLNASLEDLKEWRCGFYHWLNEEVPDGE